MEIFNMGRVFHSILFCLLFSGEISKSFAGYGDNGELSKEGLGKILKFIVAVGNIDPINPQVANIGAGFKIGEDGLVKDLTPAQNASLQEAFGRFDKDNDGIISKEEIASIFKTIHTNLAPENVAKMIAVVDKNGNGGIDLHEFKELLVKAISKEGVKRIFGVFDHDNSGSIQVTEFRNTMVKFGIMISNEEVDNAIAVIDENSDGKIHLEEFCGILADGLSKAGFRNILKFIVVLGNIDPEYPQGANIGAGTKIGKDGLVKDLTPAQNASLQEAFGRFDKDNNGIISNEEIAAIFKTIHHINLLPGKVAKMVAVVDNNGNGGIDLHEFKELLVKAISLEGTQRIFKVFDHDNSGSIQVTEFRNTMEKFGITISKEEVDNSMAAIDANSDGSIHMVEFNKILA